MPRDDRPRDEGLVIFLLVWITVLTAAAVLGQVIAR